MTPMRFPTTVSITRRTPTRPTPTRLGRDPGRQCASTVGLPGSLGTGWMRADVATDEWHVHSRFAADPSQQVWE